jgi:hypothetical protein
MNITPEAAAVRAHWREEIIDLCGPLTMSQLRANLDRIERFWPNGGISAEKAAAHLRAVDYLNQIQDRD